VSVAAEAARFCTDHGDPAKAIEIYRALLALETLSLEQRVQLLPDAIKVAENIGAMEELGAWRHALNAVKPKPVTSP
jgi:hypothetical protein